MRKLEVGQINKFKVHKKLYFYLEILFNTELYVTTIYQINFKRKFKSIFSHYSVENPMNMRDKYREGVGSRETPSLFPRDAITITAQLTSVSGFQNPGS